MATVTTPSVAAVVIIIIIIIIVIIIIIIIIVVVVVVVVIVIVMTTTVVAMATVAVAAVVIIVTVAFTIVAVPAIPVATQKVAVLVAYRDAGCCIFAWANGFAFLLQDSAVLGILHDLDLGCAANSFDLDLGQPNLDLDVRVPLFLKINDNTVGGDLAKGHGR